MQTCLCVCINVGACVRSSKSDAGCSRIYVVVFPRHICACSKSVSVWCVILLQPFTLPSPFPRHTPAASTIYRKEWLPFPMSGVPWVRLPAQGPGRLACGAGLTLEVIHSGNPPVCTFGWEPREEVVEERDKAGMGAVGNPHPSFWKCDLSLAPSQAPFLSPCSHPTKAQGRGLTISGHGNGWSFASSVRPGGALFLCASTPYRSVLCLLLISPQNSRLSSFVFSLLFFPDGLTL